jgi:hypothetical protein
MSVSRGTHEHILLYQIRDSANLEDQVPVVISPRNRVAWLYPQALGSTYPNLECQIPVFISPRNRVARLYPQALGSIFVASYNSQGYGGGIRPRLHTGDLFDEKTDCLSYNLFARTEYKIPFSTVTLLS